MPFGIKGCGEAGIIGPPAAITQAVEHALAELGVRNIGFTPLDPTAVRALIQASTEAA
jgi:aerobic carbon-monoxide dehydrogenase large subunit